MYGFILKLKVSQRFAILTIIITLAFIINGAWSFKSMHDLQVNGALYQHIAQNKDLLADVLPPPEYIIESYLLSFQLLNANDQDEQERLLARFQLLKDEYNKRYAFWSAQKLDGEVAQLFQQSYQSAQAFYTTAFNELVPAILNNDRTTARPLMSQLNQSYAAHRFAIDKIIPFVRL